MSALRLVFLGSDPIALPLLDWLAGDGAGLAEVVAVFTQPDRPAGRGQSVMANPVKAWAVARGLPVCQPEKVREEAREALASFTPDLALVMAYGHILRDEFIATPRMGTLNLHTSILPKYRGASPIQSAIASGERETGVTLMRIVRRLDAGPVAEVERVTIGALDTAADIQLRLAAACVPLLGRTLPRLRDGTLAFVPQDEAVATFCRKLEKTDGALDFGESAEVLAARVNGLFPWPACVVTIQGQNLKLGLADAIPGEGAAGEIVGVDQEGILIGTRAGLLRGRKLQRPGGKMLAAAEFLRGFPIPIGTRIPSQPMKPLLVPPKPG
ncbi:MAG: methionyl-tRNA formyltransferase [Verrucomicrobia bacterium]|nr:methionyl-tRNA formyltransferase [Verrucomicrobiota bacterium]